MDGSAQMIDAFVKIDELVTLAINGVYSPFTDRMWQLFSEIRIWFPLYAFIMFILIRRFGWKRGLVYILSLVLGLVLCDQISNLFKYSVGRLRPCCDWEMMSGGLRVLEDRGGYYGFFSAHAANVFSLAVASSIEMKSDDSSHWRIYSAFIFIWASLVAISRVFVGKHFFGDVLVGTAVGLAIGVVMGLLARKVAAIFSES